MDNNLASNENCALKEEELEAVSGGRADEHLTDARQCFARGDFLGGLQALSEYKPPAVPGGGWW